MLPSKSFAPKCHVRAALIRKHLKGQSITEHIRAQRGHFKQNCLLSPWRIDLNPDFLTSMPKAQRFVSPVDEKGCFTIIDGYWMLLVQYDRNKKDLDFTISVIAGKEKQRGVSLYRFDPDAIEEGIVSQNGREVYERWKASVISDLPTLKGILKTARNLIREPITSTTCSKRSSRLCKSVGIDVINDIAVLMPSDL